MSLERVVEHLSISQSCDDKDRLRAYQDALRAAEEGGVSQLIIKAIKGLIMTAEAGEGM